MRRAFGEQNKTKPKQSDIETSIRDGADAISAGVSKFWIIQVFIDEGYSKERAITMVRWSNRMAAR